MRARPDITVFIHSLGGGGAERVAVTLCNAFIERNKRVHLIVMTKDGVYWNLLSPKVEVFNLRCNKMWRALLPLTYYLLNQRPKKLLSIITELNAAAIIANLLAFKPSQVFPCEHSTFSYIAHLQTGRRKYIYARLPLLYHLASKVICVSKGVAEDLRSFVSLPASKIAVVYNPIMHKELLQWKSEPLDHPWVNSQEKIVLSVGRLDAAKNYSLLIEAFAEVRKRYNIKLIILGEGTERQTLQRLIDTLKLSEDVDMPGFKENPYNYMASATLFVLSSNLEGLPTVLLEALACGTPVISTDCKSGPQEILEDNTYGILVPVGDKSKLVDAITKGLTHIETHREMATAFQQKKLCEFMPEAVITKYLEALELQ